MAEDLLTADPTAAPAEPTSWHADEYKEIVTQRGWSAPDDVLKSYVNLDKEMGGREKLPTAESSADEISAFYTKVGQVCPALIVPDNADGYEIKDVPENVPRNEMMEVAMRTVAKEQNIPKIAFEAQVKRYYDALSQQIAQARVEGENNLKGEWKDKYETNLEIAKRFAREGGEEFIGFLEASGIGNNPVVIKAFYNYGTKTLDDSLIKGVPATTKKDEYKPAYPDSPAMYAFGDDEDSKKARAYFEARGHKY